MEYVKNIAAIAVGKEGEAESLYGKAAQGDEEAKARLVEIYMHKAVEIAQEMNVSEASLKDLVNEGIIGSLLGIEKLTGAEDADRIIVAQMKESMCALLEKKKEN